MKKHLLFALVGLVCSVPAWVVNADDPSATRPEAAVAAPASLATSPDAARTSQGEDRFSWGRFFLEALVGGAIGSGVSYGTYRAICGDSSCVGGSLAGIGANFALTPLAVYGLGALTGGDGSLGSAYWGGLVGFGLGGAAFTASAGAGLAVSMIALPFASAAAYEISSLRNVAEVPKPQPLAWRPSISPVIGRHGLEGASASVAGTF